MSGFDPAWLSSREPVDHRSRNAALLEAVAARFAGRETIAVVDLGCGTGSNLRALAPRLEGRQRWTLVDHDPALLAAAKARVSGDPGTRDIEVSFAQADLSADLERALGDTPDLVTAAALFDLVSEAFIDRLVEAVTARRATFYTVLSYDGTERWEPPHDADAAIHGAFLRHQSRDKGFGPAAGPAATQALLSAFLGRGYRVATGDSPWVLGSEDAELIAANATGIAEAARETGEVDHGDVDAWLAARRTATACIIGHQDLLAVPA
jgi:SAM-dependent methyltransferase